MALITCPECKHQVSDQAKTCPSCGYPIPQRTIDMSPAPSTPTPTLIKGPGVSSENQSTNTTKQSIGTQAQRILGALIGIAIGKYSGINLLIPLLASSLIMWLANKYFSESRKALVPAVAIQGGHAVWMATALPVLGFLYNFVIVDVLAVVLGLLWLVRNQSQGAIYFLGAYQVLSIIVNVIDFSGAEIGSTAHRGLVVHIILRVLAVYFLGKLFMEKRRAPEPARAA